MKYEIGEIYPENLPSEIRKLPKVLINNNESLIKILNLDRPTKRDLNDLIFDAFSIPLNKRMTQNDKVGLLINWWSHRKISSERLALRINNLMTEKYINSSNLDHFQQILEREINGELIPGDEFDECISELQKEFEVNDYSEFLIC